MAERIGEHDARFRRQLITPEGVDLGVVLGDAGQRASAFLLDTVVIGLILFGMTLFVLFGLWATGGGGLEVFGIFWVISWFMIRNFYFVWFELKARAATPGKRWVGLRVIARDGGRLTADAVIARNLMREIEVFLPLTFLTAGGGEDGLDSLTILLGFAWTAIFMFFPLLNRDRLRVGDLLAGTWVVRANKSALQADLSLEAKDAPAAFNFTPAQLDSYGIFELQKLEELLRRPWSEDRKEVAETIAAKIAWNKPIDDVDAFLSAYYAGLRANLERRLLLGKRRENKFDK